MPSTGDIARFWAKVEKLPGEDACWLWQGKGRVGWGYGVHTVDGKHTTSNRAAYEIQVGPIPPGLCVLHRCDQPLCVRGDHLRVGTRQENTQDMVAKGRAARGTRKKNHKLTEEKVREIRRRYAAGDSPSDLQREYGVILRTVWDVIERRRWAWVA